MEDKELEKIFKPLREIFLSPKEKADLKFKLLSQIEARAPEARQVSYFWPQTLGVSLSLILLAGLGSAWAAEYSLPGDLLYPIKTSVNEKVMEKLATTPEAQTEVKTKILKRRLVEVETLSLKGELKPEETEKTKGEVIRLTQETKEALAQVENLPQKNELEIELKGAINAHKEILAELKKDKKEEKLSLVLEALTLEDKAPTLFLAATPSATNTSSSTNKESGDEKKKEKIDKKIKKVKEKLEKEKEDEQESSTSTKLRLEKAEELVKEGEKSFKEDRESEAGTILDQAWQSVEEAKEIKEVKKELEKRVKPEKLEIKLEGKIF